MTGNAAGSYTTPAELARLAAIISGFPTTLEQDIGLLNGAPSALIHNLLSPSPLAPPVCAHTLRQHIGGEPLQPDTLSPSSMCLNLLCDRLFRIRSGSPGRFCATGADAGLGNFSWSSAFEACVTGMSFVVITFIIITITISHQFIQIGLSNEAIPHGTSSVSTVRK